MLNQNEKCLLKFISCANKNHEKENEILSTVLNLGIKIKFCDLNPVYQIIDEMNFSSYEKNALKES